MRAGAFQPDGHSPSNENGSRVAGKKRKKLRIAFQKNRKKRRRALGLTHEPLAEHDAHGRQTTPERLSGKGELTRYRTIVGTQQAGGELVRDVDEARCLSGRVIASAGLNSLVEANDGRRYECTVRRVLRTMSREARNVVVAGDHVLFQPLDELQGVIERVEPRHGTISRQTAGKEQMLVANVDQVLVVASAANPPLKINFVDRLLVSARKGEITPIVCINKVDLVDRTALQSLAGMYGRLGYDIVLASAERGWGIERLRMLLKDRQTVVAGQSGVGKSSLLNALQPGLSLETGDISGWTKKGKHTTRRAHLIKLDFGAWVFDTPGIRQLLLWDVSAGEVEGHFVEFRPFVARCRFPDCTHRHENGCAVRDAVERDLISPTRYRSYLRILDDTAG
jgi:ribosome biogenesis GTPase